MTARICDGVPHAPGADDSTSVVAGRARPDASFTGSLELSHNGRRLTNAGNHPLPDVDVLCVGSGIASLAVAIATADAGLSVRIVDCNPSDMACVGHTVSGAPSWATEFQHRWGVEALTERTRWYLDALTEGFGPPSRLELSAAPPLSVIDSPKAVPTKHAGTNTVPPFFGHQLNDWARQCLASPYGFLCSDVCRPRTTTLRLLERGIVEAAVVGSAPAGGLSGAMLADWLSCRARERGIQVHEGGQLRQLFFTNGHMSGAVINGPSGRHAFRSRHGMVLATGSRCMGTELPECELPPDAVLHVCLVTKIASRFGRIELLAQNSGGQLLQPIKHRDRLLSGRAEQASSLRTMRRSGRRIPRRKAA
jgi:hypothetical protein